MRHGSLPTPRNDKSAPASTKDLQHGHVFKLLFAFMWSESVANFMNSARLMLPALPTSTWTSAISTKSSARAQAGPALAARKVKDNSETAPWRKSAGAPRVLRGSQAKSMPWKHRRNLANNHWPKFHRPFRALSVRTAGGLKHAGSRLIRIASAGPAVCAKRL